MKNWVELLPGNDHRSIFINIDHIVKIEYQGEKLPTWVYYADGSSQCLTDPQEIEWLLFSIRNTQ